MSARPGTSTDAQWTFIDLFAGIGGFHAALSALGGECVWASEIDNAAASVYSVNWGLRPDGDITAFTQPAVTEHVPEGFEVLAAGFPCQPFSKSGKQHGFRDTTRGTLFFDICQILEARRPQVILLENVRNLAGPRQRETWQTIVRTLRDLGYRVSDTPTVFSPHLLPPELGGTPQVRERVFITGTYVGPERAWAEAESDALVPLRPVAGHDPQLWDLSTLLDTLPSENPYTLRPAEARWIDCWDDLVARLLEERNGVRLPGFPLWADHFVPDPEDEEPELPAWKADFLRKNSAFFNTHRETVAAWRRRWFPNWHPDWDESEERLVWTSPESVDGPRYEGEGDVYFPPSRRKLEWQAQDAASLWDTIMHLRPSGIRAKRPTYVPALVAITQTSIYGPARRRITPREAARLQGLPEWFAFASATGETQPDPATYKQLGNGVSVGAAYYVLRQHILRDRADLESSAPSLVDAVERAGAKPLLLQPRTSR
ncbi:DNA (cytosine-5)-methyltransferase 1 [Motilibacter peucedani]|uniref:Cytosine-specific methyltransferase n=1 Tax=Motilibacter peucedani TaxID=598650 RepID=A0A420XRP9_9ACTN|nr:DNA (cytosine-5-)-methyltransferase [Motilibacter peucedani]RKS77489.1 DNA (cytosine-5)-methyltransferase 1 [Motilibacter peucedani]